jgi:hypothetical protein
MPQIFLTFDEIADLFHCDAAGARSRVIENQWERRRCADGLPRVYVPPEVGHAFMLNYALKFEQRLPAAQELAVHELAAQELVANEFEGVMFSNAGATGLDECVVPVAKLIGSENDDLESKSKFQRNDFSSREGVHQSRHAAAKL